MVEATPSISARFDISVQHNKTAPLKRFNTFSEECGKYANYRYLFNYYKDLIRPIAPKASVMEVKVDTALESKVGEIFSFKERREIICGLYSII